MEINLDNPIFVYYFDAQNHSSSFVDQTIHQLSKKMSQYTNITFWIVPSNFSKIECVFDGWKSNIYSLNRLLECLETIKTDPSFSEFKQKMREILIEDITNGTEQKQK